MTALTEPPRMPAGEAERPLGARWRAAAERAQGSVLPSGRVVASCSAPLGVGGLGRHLQEILAALDRRGQESVCICGSTWASLPPVPGRVRRGRGPARALAPLLRFSPAWRMLRVNAQFDSRAALRLPAADHLISFNGACLRQLEAARAARYQSVALMSATSHMRRVTRQHALAYRQYPLERSWAGHLLRRNLREYARADRIYVSSQHAWGSFLEEGFPEHRLSLFPLTPDPRFEVARASQPRDTFDIVYVGSLSVAKGVPLLVDAVRRVAGADIRLLLVGGWATRGMRRFITEACAQDPRITLCQGDPLQRLRGARLYVHPSYEDGFGYAPAEALACGVPVIVSENTGMKELIVGPHSGLILPTGGLDPLCEAIEAAHRGEILSG